MGRDRGPFPYHILPYLSLFLHIPSFFIITGREIRKYKVEMVGGQGEEGGREFIDDGEIS